MKSPGAPDSLALLAQAAGDGSRAFDVLSTHGQVVAQKALELLAGIAEHGADLEFVEQAAMLHDVGAAFTRAPDLGLEGREPYIRHGVLGRAFLDQRGWPRHALVCERHVGVGLTRVEIERRGLPLPKRDMRPEGLEEIAICFADKFYSKMPGKLTAQRTLEQVRRSVGRYGADKVAVIDDWAQRFGLRL